MSSDFSKLLLIGAIGVAGFFGYQELKSKKVTKSVEKQNNVTSDFDIGRASFSPEFAKKMADNKEKNSPEKVKEVIKKLVD